MLAKGPCYHSGSLLIELGEHEMKGEEVPRLRLFQTRPAVFTYLKKIGRLVAILRGNDL